MAIIRYETIMVPPQFKWVIIEWIKWHESCSKTGDVIIKYKNGGISGMLLNEYLMPPKK